MKPITCQAAVHAASDELAGLLSDAERDPLAVASPEPGSRSAPSSTSTSGAAAPLCPGPGKGWRSAAVATVEPGASTEFGEAKPDDDATLDQPPDLIARAIVGWPVRTEAPLVVDVPLAVGRTTVLDVRGSATGLENLGGPVGEDQLSRRQRSREERRCDDVPVRHLDVIESFDHPTG